MEDQTTYLYRFFDRKKNLLYIGIALNHLSRLAQHAAEKPWFAEIADIKVESFDTRSEAIEAEYRAIKRERPKYNVHHNHAPTPERPAAPRAPLTPDDGDQIRLISIRTVCELTSLSRTQINVYRSQGKFPREVALGEKRIAFVKAEVIEWINGRIFSRAA